MYLLDTNVIIQFLDGSLSEAGKNFIKEVMDDQCNLSIITKMEVLGFNFISVTDETSMNNLLSGSEILHINDAVVDKTIIIRKIKKIGLPDAIIAATALVYDFTLVTRNKSDFKNINGLKIINPFDL